MSKALTIIKPGVRELHVYSLRADRAPIKLNQNESAWDAPVRIQQETLNRLRERAWSRYPDFVPSGLHEQLAAHCGWVPEGIVAGNGSNELIQALLMIALGPGRRLLISEPTFALYRQIATILDAEIVSVPLTRRFEFDIPALIRSIESVQPEVIVICSPNNPTGSVIPQRALKELLQIANGLVVVDEAYFEFSEDTSVTLLRHFENLVVFRTFSKAMALAGLRVGYLVAAPQLAREIAKAVLPYNVNIISQIAAGVAIELYESELKPRVAVIRSERERIFSEIGKIAGLEPVKSQANFMIVRSCIPPREVYRRLLERGILIRDVSGYPQLGDFFRFSIGTCEENDALLRALKEIVNEGKTETARNR